MEYPNEFPQDSRARVDAAKAKAERDFFKAKPCLPSSRAGYKSGLDKLVKEYIFCVLSAFAREAIEIAKKGLWPANQIQGRVEVFGKDLICEAAGKRYDRYGFQLPQGYAWEFQADVWEAIESSDLWLALLDQVAEVAEAQVANNSCADPQKADGKRAAKWEDIEIRFLSDERIQIAAPGLNETRNYAEMGFADARNGTPNQAWQTLRTLAESGGKIGAAKTGRDWAKVEKRMQEIRRVLREHFGISDDPLPFLEGTGYNARFKMACSISYQT